MNISRRDWLATVSMAGMLALARRAVSRQANEEGHVVLLGDSIFDNKVYVGSQPAVIDQVRSTLGGSWAATLLAVDGDVTKDVLSQVRRMPATASHIVISVGGNDALMNQGILRAGLKSEETFARLSKIQRQFDGEYKAMMTGVLELGKPTAICTIYDPNYDNRALNRIAATALSVFNDRITRIAFEFGVPIIDLRILFSNKDDYANPIEPGPKGGAKIAQQIKRIVTQHDFSRKQSVVYPAAG